MRLVIRVLIFESALSWAMILAGWVRIGFQVGPVALRGLKAGSLGRIWRVGLGLLIGLPVGVGWPVLMSPALARYTSGDWLKLAVIWWVIVGAVGLLLLVAKVTEAGARARSGAGCQCGTCVARGLD
jgi:hypothetical protein